jgi:hypothetical protein
MNTVSLHFKKITRICLIVVALGGFAFSPEARAAPTPDPPAAGVLNTADGQSALPFVTTGVAKSAFGAFSMFSNTTGNNNTALGVAALDLNNADNNTAVGAAALLFNGTGSNNTAVGTAALENNDVTGNGIAVLNTAVGSSALLSNTDGEANTAVGAGALLNNSIASANVAIGDAALSSNDVTGTGLAIFNTAVGAGAMAANTDGANNVAVGNGAGDGIMTGDNNVAVGYLAGFDISTGNNIIAIGAFTTGVSTGLGQLDDSCYIANIHGQSFDPGGSPAFVQVDADGKLGTAPSSRRFKKDIRPMDQASEVLLALKPVTFHYKCDKKNTPQSGLLAEDVEEVDPGLITRDKEGKVYSVRYDQVNAMLLNEFLKEHRKVRELEANAENQQKQIEALTAGLQKVSAQLELSKPAPQAVLNNQQMNTAPH